MNYLRRRLRNSFVAILLSFPFLFFSGCDYGEIKSKATVGETTIYVDENLEPLLNDLKSEFERIYKEAKVNFVVKPAKVAIADLLNRDHKVILVARDFNEEENKFIKDVKLEIQRYEVALDGIGFIVNPASPIERLTSSDLKKIFTGEYKNWTDIKVQDEEQNQKAKQFFKGNLNEIKLYIQRPNSSAYELVKDSVLDKMNFSESARVCSTSAQLIEGIRKHKNAIGFVNLAWISIGNQDEQDTTVRGIRVSRIYPSGRQTDFEIFHQGTVAYRKYPYIRKVYLFSTEFDFTAAYGFTTFLLHADGQKVILKRGLVPVTQPVRIIKLE
ncbi:MAG: substrate-binding domain-containing protein [Ignavibacteria bacterium]|nr:substrate-binding domain-containing protein [Ignavibacteria bacterium]